MNVDNGILTSKSQLPVTQLNYGGGSNRFSWILYEVDFLKCQGKSDDGEYPSARNSNRIAAIEADIEQNQNKIEENQNNIEENQNKIEESQNKIEENQNNIEENQNNIEENQNNIEENQNKISEVAYFTATPTAHFSTGGQPIPFPNIVNEQNSGFDGSTGVMTTQIKGLYHFTASIMADSSAQLDVYLMHNNNPVHRAYESASGYNMVTVTATLPLQIGDSVFVKINSGPSYGSSVHYGVFTAFKISAI